MAFALYQMQQTGCSFLKIGIAGVILYRIIH
ncbi:hypothetical protein SAMN05421545_1255 [Pontibacter lucknowensis]|uniref:Uncharacterized protein n=1 Tax=Pontibacter lucknowensis TaxID=1077936 RepID=A0A1N6VX33_9BACT|nr:hypothetical protein SAMN05421545_1255 [Pontibacter lucknowensis]